MLPGVAVAIGIDVKKVSKAIPLCRVVKNVVVGCIAGAKDEAEHDSAGVARGGVVPHIVACTDEHQDAEYRVAGVVIAQSVVIGGNSSGNGGAEDFSKRKTVSQGK